MKQMIHNWQAVEQLGNTVEQIDNHIKEQVTDVIESGALDETVANAVDNYLEENPVDITALEGQDIAPKDINATGNITAPSIIENMSGYSCTKVNPTGWTFENVYMSVVKNGNKLTIVYAFNATKTADNAEAQPMPYSLTIPTSIYNKLYETQVGAYNFLDNKVVKGFSSYNDAIDVYGFISKTTNNRLFFYILSNNFVKDTKYYVRYETTFLLSDNIVS